MKTDYERTGRLYPKIDLFVRGVSGGWVYYYTTQQWKRCKDARASFALHQGLDISETRAFFAR